MILPAITERQHATILAALREWQRLLQGFRDNSDIATDGFSLKALDANEIDVLCERLNTQVRP